jgi:tetratricopeptide (TPR) repeat protein
MEQDARIEQLHEKASQHYLQGNFDAALAAWRELLAVCPTDERALEGVRLCEMLAGDEAAAAAGQEHMPETFELTDPTETDLPPRPEAEAAAPDPGEQGFDFDFTEIGEAGAGAATVDDEAAATGATAANELANRTRELVEEASRAYEQGRRDDALSLIQRVFILDEANETATSLQDIINAEIEAEREDDPVGFDAPSAAAEPPPPPPPAPSAAGSNHEPMDASGPSETLELDLDAPAPQPAAQANAAVGTLEEDAAEPAEAPLEELDLPEMPAGSGDAEHAEHAEFGEPGEVEALELPEPLPLPAKRGGIPKWAIAVAAVVVVAGGAWVAFGLMAGPAPAVEAEPLPVPEPTPELPPEITGEAGEEEEAAPATAQVDRTELEDLLQRGRSAFESGDFSAAVLAYGEAARMDPTNTEARRQLEAAGDRYREQKEAEAKWEEAIRSFNQGDFRTALQVFYRLPVGADEVDRVRRYKRNAWYNMGVQALRSGDCVRSREHFGEADQADPGNAAVKAALDLAARCGGPGDRDYFREVDALGYRGLDD